MAASADVRSEVERARAFEREGRIEEAKAAYLAALGRDATDFEALNGLATLLFETGYSTAARTAYAEAVRLYPDNPVGQVNLANLLLAAGEPAAARAHYERALVLAPDLADAHRGLAYALDELGEPAAAEAHRRCAHEGRAVIVQPRRAAGEGAPLLLLVSAAGGAIPTRHLIDEARFQTTVLVADYFDVEAPLPPHALIFNAIGDADLCASALEAAERIIAGSAAPVINRPNAVLATGREAVARRFAGSANIETPRIARLPRAALAGPGGVDAVLELGFGFPLLLRSPGFHTGRHFARVEAPGALAAVAATLPGAELLVIQPLDACGPDGLYRKFRAMMVDGALYPLHLATSADWKVHFFTADMAGDAARRAADAAFLADMAGVIGPRAMRALGEIRDALGLDYGGVDFAVGPDGRLLLFEANPTMVVNPPDADPLWDYRRAPVERVLEAARQLIRRRSDGAAGR
jgi:hypothetical protein